MSYAHGTCSWQSVLLHGTIIGRCNLSYKNSIAPSPRAVFPRGLRQNFNLGTPHLFSIVLRKLYMLLYISTQLAMSWIATANAWNITFVSVVLKVITWTSIISSNTKNKEIKLYNCDKIPQPHLFNTVFQLCKSSRFKFLNINANMFNRPRFHMKYFISAFSDRVRKIH